MGTDQNVLIVQKCQMGPHKDRHTSTHKHKHKHLDNADSSKLYATAATPKNNTSKSNNLSLQHVIQCHFCHFLSPIVLDQHVT